MLSMKTILKLLALLGSLTLGPLLSAQDYLPLGVGNYWIYQSTSTTESFTIRAGTPFSIGNRTYYSVSGYGASKLLLRADDGTVVAWNEETEQEDFLTGFAFGTPYGTNLSGCRQQAEADSKSRQYAGPAGFFPASQTIHYTSTSCADSGFQEEVYLDNIGLARRTVNTIRGPITYELVEARVGKFTFTAHPSTQTRLSLENNSVQRRNTSEPFQLRAALTISTIGALPVKVIYPTSQQYDLVLRNASGEVVYRWSDGRMFAQALSSEHIGGPKSVHIEAEFNAAASSALPDGVYTVEAWLTTGEGPRFASSAAVEIFTGPLV